MLCPISRFTVSASLARRLQPTRTPFVHGWSSSWGSPQPLLIFRSCPVHPQNISSWSQSLPTFLYSLCSCCFSSLTTHRTLLLLLHGWTGVIQDHQGIPGWYMVGTLRERPQRSYKGWTAPPAMYRYQEITRHTDTHLPSHYHQCPPNTQVTIAHWYIIFTSCEEITLGSIYSSFLWIFKS